MNLINLTEVELDKSIYRVFSLKRFEELFATEKLTLVRPHMWDDPFENFILKSKVKNREGKIVEILFRDNLYGQCWTLNKESDAMWRIYSPEKKGVKVKTTIRKLISALYDSSPEDRDYKERCCYIGKVQYKKKDELLELLGNSQKISDLLFDPSWKGHAQTLLWKRLAFKHEREIRLIYRSPLRLGSDTYTFSFDPYKFIDEIVFDPRMPLDEYRILQRKYKLACFPNKIIRSGLYSLPEFEWKLNF